MRAHAFEKTRVPAGEVGLATTAMGHPSSDAAGYIADSGPWPCGYCRIDSLAEVGCRCPACGRSKAPAWWKTCKPTTVRTLSSDTVRRSEPVGLGLWGRMRRHATAIALVAIFTAGLGLSAGLAVRSTAEASGTHPPRHVELKVSAGNAISPHPVPGAAELEKNR